MTANGPCQARRRAHAPWTGRALHVGALLLALLYAGAVVWPRETIDMYHSDQFQHYNYLIQVGPGVLDVLVPWFDQGRPGMPDQPSTVASNALTPYLAPRMNPAASDILKHRIQDPFFDFPTPRIEWVRPGALVPHEYTSHTHLANLIAYLTSLSTLDPRRPIPIPVVTATQPSVILDGHHRVAAAMALGLPRLPVWVVEDEEEERAWDTALIRCYSRDDGSRMPIRQVVWGARAGRIEWGIKGTRHVAIVSEYGREVELERVTPRVRWHLWLSVGVEEPPPPPTAATSSSSVGVDDGATAFTGAPGPLSSASAAATQA